MKTVDRSILIALTLGVWAMILQPYVTEAHNEHCTISSAHGYGYVDDRNVTTSEDIFSGGYKEKLNNYGSVTINRISGDILSY